MAILDGFHGMPPEHAKKAIDAVKRSGSSLDADPLDSLIVVLKKVKKMFSSNRGRAYTEPANRRGHSETASASRVVMESVMG
jgi:hypothetical protein